MKDHKDDIEKVKAKTISNIIYVHSKDITTKLRTKPVMALLLRAISYKQPLKKK